MHQPIQLLRNYANRNAEVRKANTREMAISLFISFLTISISTLTLRNVPTGITLFSVIIHFETSKQLHRHYYLRECDDPYGISISGILLPLVSMIFPSTISNILSSGSIWALSCTLSSSLSTSLSTGTVFSMLICVLLFLEDNNILLLLCVPVLALCLVNSCRRTFTITESCLLSCLMISTISNALTSANANDMQMIIDISLTACVTFSILCVMIPASKCINFTNSNFTNSNLGTYACVVIIFVTYVTIHLKMSNNIQPIPYIMKYILFTNKKRIQLILFWIILLAITVIIQIVRTNDTKTSPTILRKVYHIVAFIIYYSGIQTDMTILKLGSIFGLLLFLVVESIRLRCIGSMKLHKHINQFANTLVDKRDAGPVVTSHIYLLLGCAIPVWCCYDDVTVAKGGIVSVCVQDGVAATFGKLFGKTIWGRRGRTLEGSVAGVIAACLVMAVWIEDVSQIFNVFLAASAAGLVEAFTDQADNLLVPLTFCSVYKALLI